MGEALDFLSIRGFKSIRNLEDFPLHKLNILVGANGSGKSNFIDFFRLLRKIIDGNFHEYIRENGGINDVLFGGRQTTESITAQMRFGQRGYRFTIQPGPKENAALVKEARYYKGGHSKWWELGDSPDGLSLLALEAQSTRADSRYSKPVYDSIASWVIYHFHDTGRRSGMRNSEIIQDNTYLRFNASNIAPYLLRLRNEHPQFYQAIVHNVRLVAPFFDDFRLDVTAYGDSQKVSLSWRQKGSDYPMQPYHLSDGSIRFICLAAVLLQPSPPSTIILDEPELGLHPAAISLLAELVNNAAQSSQLIIATQSPAFLDHFSVDDLIIVKRQDGSSTFQRLCEQDLAVWLQEYSMGELWTKNIIQGGISYE